MRPIAPNEYIHFGNGEGEWAFVETMTEDDYGDGRRPRFAPVGYGAPRRWRQGAARRGGMDCRRTRHPRQLHYLRAIDSTHLLKPHQDHYSDNLAGLDGNENTDFQYYTGAVPYNA